MKKNILVFLLISVVVGVNAQAIKPNSDTAKVAKQIIIDDEECTGTYVESMPEYKGGEKVLMKFIKDSLIYPKTALENRIQGLVIVRFVVDEKGATSQYYVLKGLGYGCDEEAIRVIKKLTRWIPGKQSGKSIAVWYNLPIRFDLPK